MPKWKTLKLVSVSKPVSNLNASAEPKKVFNFFWKKFIAFTYVHTFYSLQTSITIDQTFTFMQMFGNVRPIVLISIPKSNIWLIFGPAMSNICINIILKG